jgi:hypothetical protein
MRHLDWNVYVERRFEDSVVERFPTSSSFNQEIHTREIRYILENTLGFVRPIRMISRLYLFTDPQLKFCAFINASNLRHKEIAFVILILIATSNFICSASNTQRAPTSNQSSDDAAQSSNNYALTINT